MTYVLNGNDFACFATLSVDDLLLIEGGSIARTAVGVVGGAVGGVIAFVGTASATTPICTPLGGAVLGAIATPAGAAAGYMAAVSAYDGVVIFFSKKK